MDTSIENNVHKFIRSLKESTSPGIFSEDLRMERLDQLTANNFPTSRQEYWKYTRVNRISTKAFKIAPGFVNAIDAFKIKNLNSDYCVFVNGFYDDALSCISEENKPYISILSNLDNKIAQQPVSSEIFDQINVVFATDGIHLDIPKNKILNRPIEIIHLQSGQEVIANVYHHFQIGEHAQAKILLSFYSSNDVPSFSNIRLYANLNKGAHLNITKIQAESNQSYHISTEDIDQLDSSNFTINTITLGGELVRNNLNIRVNGKNCETNLHAAYILKENQHVDNHTLVDHKVAHCQSNELYKGVISDKATAVFNGKVFVRKDAQKINAFQSNGNVLLSNTASVNSKPELEIYADDVKCSHGSTTGQLDEKAVFYLRSRGLSEKEARELLVQAFIADVLEKIDDEPRAHIDEILEKRFGWELI